MTLMHRRIYKISSYASILSVAVAVIMMAPSAGLITLTIPDETSTAASIPDTQHIAKRASDDVRHIALDIIGTVAEIHPRLLHGETIAASICVQAPDAIPEAAQIRGPPIG